MIVSTDRQQRDRFNCYFVEWSGRMKKYRQCRKYQDYLASANLEEAIDFGPEYKAPIILLHGDKKQRDMEGLVALIPPLPVTEPLLFELEFWLRSTCLAWYKKALNTGCNSSDDRDIC